MQVACEHCGAEYDLDGKDISGRGARITCPTCSHVFIVYQQPKSVPQTPKPPVEEFEIEIDFDALGLGSDDFDAVVSDTTGTVSVENASAEEQDLVVEDSIEIDIDMDAFINGLGSEESEVEKDVKEQPPVISTPTSTEVVQTTVNESEVLQTNVAQAVEESVESDKAISDADIAALDVLTLNFASVGIKSWKVKKTIGLMFEYSDFKTFKKSLTDGRISRDDQISPDGKNWLPMADISDFEYYFCKTYLEFEKMGVKPEAKSLKEKVVQPLGGMNELASALAAAQAEVEQANQPSSKSNRNNAKSKAKPKPSSASARQASSSTSAPSSGSSSLLVNVAIGLLVLGGGWTFFGQSKTPSVDPVVTTPKMETPQTEEGVQEDILKEMRAELKKNTALIEEQNPEVEEPSNEETQLMVKVPEEILAQQRAMAEGKTAGPVAQKPVQMNYALEGQKALTSKQWAKAIEHFQNALKTTSNGEYKASIGYAQMKLGQHSQAKKTLQEALNMNSISAKKWMGYLLQEEGDDAGANQYFNQYLSSNPQDAAEIRKAMVQ